ncbi:hypothetical protein D3C85_1906970 [compost metagenome]
MKPAPVPYAAVSLKSGSICRARYGDGDDATAPKAIPPHFQRFSRMVAMAHIPAVT